jgi:hypothetical protein
MSAIKLRGLSVSESEEAIAALWTCLEEYGIPSPKLKVSRANSRITIEIAGFDEPLWAELVDTYLTNWQGGALQLPSANTNKSKASEWAQVQEKAKPATSFFRGIAGIPLGAFAEINRKAKRRYHI